MRGKECAVQGSRPWVPTVTAQPTQGASVTAASLLPIHARVIVPCSLHVVLGLRDPHAAACT